MRLGLLLVASMIALTNTAYASDSDSLTMTAQADTGLSAVGKPIAAPSEGLTYLVPSMKDAGWKVTNDRDRFKRRISFSPAYGKLGTEDLFAFRIGYSPNTWLGYEASLGHNPASSLHGMLHTFNVILRYPISGRFQPYATLGYGMMTVYPGQAINADPVTKNALAGGGGLELYIRNDVALRAEVRGATVLGQQLHSEGTVAYDYLEYTIGFSFFRSLGS